ncbi:MULTISPECIES: hypothetical protein, partial [unclassified Microcoleus]|uniref:hypothetical protein n=1 Tax=unclassified Microcoleus TaxID=2642155 RepID=UPI002FD177EB
LMSYHAMANTSLIITYSDPFLQGTTPCRTSTTDCGGRKRKARERKIYAPYGQGRIRCGVARKFLEFADRQNKLTQLLK